ncbi:MAG: serine/threonine-protein kinase [Pseudomonadota bacterium]
MADFELPGYELYERLGRGGMASVYRALHLNLDREVAIKVMDPAMSADENFSERFIREARISARLTHPSILQIYDVNTFSGMNYIAMEYLPAGDLADIIYTGIAQSTIYEVMRQMTEALDYAAGQGYVHRDIKPSNIMLRGKDDYVLADFGIARAANSGTQMTQTGLMVGTPSYMSPEQAKGLEVDGRSDLYALAVLWYEMMVKALPYDSDSAVTTAVKHLTEAIPTLPEHLSVYQEFLDKAMAKNPAERFQTGAELYRYLRDASAGFNDDQVLTPAREVPEQSTAADADIGGDGTVVSDSGMLAGSADQTQVSGASLRATGSARPYKLEGTAQRERLVSGMYAKEQTSSGSSKGLWIVLLLVALGGGGYAAYTTWQDQQEASQRGMRSVAESISMAYRSLEADDLTQAVTAFSEVLELDSGNRAARQGLADVEKRFGAQISAALSERDVATASGLLDEMAAVMPNSQSMPGLLAQTEALQGELAAAEAEALAVAEAEQALNALLLDASSALDSAAQDLARGPEAAELFRRALEMEPDNGAALDGLDKLTAYYADAADDAANAGDFVRAEDLLVSGLAVFPGQSELQALQASLPGLEEAWLAAAEARAEEEARLAAEQAAAAEALAAAQADANAAMAAIGGGELASARDTYEDLLEEFPDMDATVALGAQLLTAYADLAREQLEIEDYDAVESTLENGRSLAPDYADWLELETELEAARTSSRRRLGAF